MIEEEIRQRGFIRSHPLFSLWIALTVTPLVIAAGLLAIRYMPACAEWRREVRQSAQIAMKERYIGEYCNRPDIGKDPAFHRSPRN